MDLENIARTYFSTFQNKDLHSLSDMFDEEISLKDWNIFAQGKKFVMEANAEIFNALDKIEVNVLNLYSCGMTIIAEIVISINDADEILPVVDIITFNSDGKIESIVAYRGN